MCEWLRTYMMETNTTLRKKGNKWGHRIMLKSMKRLDWEIEFGGNWYPPWSDDFHFEAENKSFTKGFVVDI